MLQERKACKVRRVLMEPQVLKVYKDLQAVMVLPALKAYRDQQVMMVLPAHKVSKAWLV